MADQNLVISFFISLLASLLAVVVVLVIEAQRRPKLRFTIGQMGEIDESNAAGRPHSKILHIWVHNDPMTKYLSWAMDRSPAYACKGWITFHHTSGESYIDEAMLVRWGETPEPFTFVSFASPPNQIEPRFIFDRGKVVNHFDIPPGEYTNVPVAVRLREEKDAYGWNDESYLYEWKNPRWKLAPGRYLALLRVQTGGREFRFTVKIINDGPYEHFRLVESDKQL